jgi:hypothetical protein
MGITDKDRSATTDEPSGAVETDERREKSETAHQRDDQSPTPNSAGDDAEHIDALTDDTSVPAIRTRPTRKLSTTRSPR